MSKKKKILGSFDHTYNKGGKKGRVSEQTNKMRTKPVPQHIVQNSCGTKDTDGQRTLRDKGH